MDVRIRIMGETLLVLNVYDSSVKADRETFSEMLLNHPQDYVGPM